MGRPRNSTQVQAFPVRALILAAGYGKRLQPTTHYVPKPLVHVGGEPLISRLISQLADAGCQDIVINSAHLAAQVQRYVGSGRSWGVRIRHSYEGPIPLDTGGAMAHALDYFHDEPFIVVNSDIVTDFDFSPLTQLDLKNALAHLILINNPGWKSTGDFGLEQHLVTQSAQPGFTFAGIGLYRPELVRHHREKAFSIVPLLRAAIDQRQISGELHHGVWHDTGNWARLDAARSYFRSQTRDQCD